MISFCDTVIGNRNQETLDHGTAEFPIACYFDNLSEKSVPWHWHEEFEVGIVTQGSVLVYTPDQQCQVEQGESFFINSGILHKIEGGDSEESHLDSLVFHARLLGGNMDSIYWRKFLRPVILNSAITQLCFEKESKQKQSELIASAWMECVNSNYGFEFQVQHLLSQLFLIIKQEKIKVSGSEEKRISQYNERVKLMLTYIQEHYGDNLTVKKIAESASVSESECMRCFRKVLGASPIAYLKTYRLQSAANLISSTQWKISYIAQDCGFSEMSYFSKSFREVYHCTPSQYRVNGNNI